MYSPKIAEHLIPSIYRLARARGTHMTTLVNEALTRYLADQNLHQMPSAAAGTTGTALPASPDAPDQGGVIALAAQRAA